MIAQFNNDRVKVLVFFLCATLFSTLAVAQSDEQVSAKSEKKAHKQAIKLRKRLQRGADFHRLAKKYSDDPGSAQYGGSLGTVYFGQFVPEFEAAIRKLKPGEISEPVLTDFGYHIIQLVEIDGDQFTARHILIKP